MKRIYSTVFSIISLGVFAAWLFFSYRPGALPVQSITLGDDFTPVLRVLLFLSAGLFVVLQMLLLPPTLRFPERVARREALAPHEGAPEADEATLVLRTATGGDIRVNRALELLWTGLPILASLGVFWASFQAMAW
ncbi:MAG: hypothetical protein D6790_09975 [Caldilineae bacterium]|nr:MAG: hypothetical protein D6790_09975 [Caldilineae bacterium]